MRKRDAKSSIWKFPLHPSDVSEINMPRGANVLCVQMQGELPTLWAEVNTAALNVTRTFAVYGIGHPLHVGARSYIGTVQDGPFVWHVYELVEP